MRQKITGKSIITSTNSGSISLEVNEPTGEANSIAGVDVVSGITNSEFASGAVDDIARNKELLTNLAHSALFTQTNVGKGDIFVDLSTSSDYSQDQIMVHSPSGNVSIMLPYGSENALAHSQGRYGDIYVATGFSVFQSSDYFIYYYATNMSGQVRGGLISITGVLLVYENGFVPLFSNRGYTIFTHALSGYYSGLYLLSGGLLRLTYHSFGNIGVDDSQFAYQDSISGLVVYDFMSGQIIKQIVPTSPDLQFQGFVEQGSGRWVERKNPISNIMIWEFWIRDVK